MGGFEYVYSLTVSRRSSGRAPWTSWLSKSTMYCCQASSGSFSAKAMALKQWSQDQTFAIQFFDISIVGLSRKSFEATTALQPTYAASSAPGPNSGETSGILVSHR